MKDTILINDKKLDWLIIGEGFNIPSFNFNTEVTEVDGRAGTVFKRRQLGGYEFTIPLVIVNEWLENNKTHDDVLNELVRFIGDKNEPVKLQIKSKDWYWNAYIDGLIELPNKTTQFMELELKVVLTDPYKYALKGNYNTAISDQVSIVNSGTASTPITVEARALKNATNFMIAKDDRNYFMVGKSEDANKVNKDIEPYLFNDEFNSKNGLSGWSYMPNDTSFGNLLDGGDAMGGKFGISTPLNETIYPTEWGNSSKTNWHGPAVYKSLGTSVQDFRVKLKVLVRQHVGVGPGKAVTFVVDENNRTLFSMAYVNTGVTKNESKIVVYAYNEHGEARRIYTRETPLKYHKIKNLNVFMYLERKGNAIKITNFKYNMDVDPKRTVPIDRDTVVVNDSGNFYQRPARITRMYIGKSSRHSRYMACNIMGYSIQELLPKQSDVTPIVIRKGDFILIDTYANSVTINGEDALPLKDFASNYFNVDSGHTELVIYPPNIFDTTVKWQDRYY